MDKNLPALENNSYIKQYLALLLANGKQEDYKNIEDMVQYLSSIEKRFDEVIVQLNDLKNIIQSMNNPSVNMRMNNDINYLQKSISISKNNLIKVKDNLTTSMKIVVEQCKEKGQIATLKVVDVMHIKGILEKLQKNLVISMKKTENLMMISNQITSEYRNAKRNMKNILSLVTGTGISHKSSEIQKMNSIQKMLKTISHRLGEMATMTSKLVNRIENMERKSVKNDIRLLTDNNSKPRKSKQREEVR